MPFPSILAFFCIQTENHQAHMNDENNTDKTIECRLFDWINEMMSNKG